MKERERGRKSEEVDKGIGRVYRLGKITSVLSSIKMKNFKQALFVK